MTRTPALDDLEPRIKRIVDIVLKNREAICRPPRGTLEVRFKGRHLDVRLVVPEPLVVDDDGPTKPAA